MKFSILVVQVLSTIQGGRSLTDGSLDAIDSGRGNRKDREYNVCGVDGALKVVDKKSGLFAFTCSTQSAAAGTCHPTWERRYKMSTFKHNTAGSDAKDPPELERVNLNAAMFETLLGRKTLGKKTPFLLKRISFTWMFFVFSRNLTYEKDARTTDSFLPASVSHNNQPCRSKR